MVILPYRTKQSAPNDKCKTRTSVIDDMEVLKMFLHLVICLLPKKTVGIVHLPLQKRCESLSIARMNIPLDEEWCNVLVWYCAPRRK